MSSITLYDPEVSAAVAHFESASVGTLWGIDATVVPDFDGDGIDDVLVGEPLAFLDTQERSAGKLSVISGFDGTTLIESPAMPEVFLKGARCGTLGDLNSDGYPEFWYSAMKLKRGGGWAPVVGVVDFKQSFMPALLSGTGDVDKGYGSDACALRDSAGHLSFIVISDCVSQQLHVYKYTGGSHAGGFATTYETSVSLDRAGAGLMGMAVWQPDPGGPVYVLGIDATDGPHGEAIGVVDALDPLSFVSQATSLYTVQTPSAADRDFDGDVDGDDLLVLTGNLFLGGGSPPSARAIGDLSGDGLVNSDDVQIALVMEDLVADANMPADVRRRVLQELVHVTHSDGTLLRSFSNARANDPKATVTNCDSGLQPVNPQTPGIDPVDDTPEPPDFTVPTFGSPCEPCYKYAARQNCDDNGGGGGGGGGGSNQSPCPPENYACMCSRLIGDDDEPKQPQYMYTSTELELQYVSPAQHGYPCGPLSAQVIQGGESLSVMVVPADDKVTLVASGVPGTATVLLERQCGDRLCEAEVKVYIVEPGSLTIHAQGFIHCDLVKLPEVLDPRSTTHLIGHDAEDAIMRIQGIEPLSRIHPLRMNQVFHNVHQFLDANPLVYAGGDGDTRPLTIDAGTSRYDMLFEGGDGRRQPSGPPAEVASRIIPGRYFYGELYCAHTGGLGNI
ncbi:MAG: hypothetical protein AAGG07_01195 [Planctomycetota bacterium]